MRQVKDSSLMLMLIRFMVGGGGNFFVFRGRRKSKKRHSFLILHRTDADARKRAKQAVLAR
jgi:hypothetical protein